MVLLYGLLSYLGIARAELSSREGSERQLHPSVAHGEARGSVFSSLVLFVLSRTPNHDVAVVTTVRSELSSHLVGIHRVSRMAWAGCLFEGVVVTNVGCSSLHVRSLSGH